MLHGAIRRIVRQPPGAGDGALHAGEYQFKLHRRRLLQQEAVGRGPYELMVAAAAGVGNLDGEDAASHRGPKSTAGAAGSPSQMAGPRSSIDLPESKTVQGVLRGILAWLVIGFPAPSALSDDYAARVD